MVMGCPIASFSEYPKMRCAAAFQLVISASRSLEMIASSEDSIRSAYLNRVSSARLCSVMSLDIPSSRSGSPFAA